MMRYYPPAKVILVPVFIVLLIAAVQPQNTKAALITQYVTFTASSFQYGGPTSPITGSFTITYDPSVSTGPTSVGLTLNSLSGMTLADTPFEYIETAPVPYMSPLHTALEVGGHLALTLNLPAHYPSTFRLGYDVDYYTGEWLPNLYGFQANNENGGMSTAGMLALSVTTKQVPVPPSALLFGVGLLGLSAAGLRKRRGA
jgi:hypothetical protein